MIDEKRLDVREQNIRELDEFVAARTGVVANMRSREADEALEVIHLARLGLWAEKHGIPALRMIGSRTVDPRHASDKALSALPKERV